MTFTTVRPALPLQVQLRRLLLQLEIHIPSTVCRQTLLIMFGQEGIVVVPMSVYGQR